MPPSRGNAVAAPPQGERVELTSRRGSRLAGLFREAQALAGVPAPVAILCHGMESTKEGTKHRLLADRLGAAGISALRFDFSYVGESEGDFADLTVSGEVEDLGGAWDWLAARGTGRVGLFGSSLGGTVALLFAAAEPRVAALVTVAAVARPRRILEELRASDLERWRREGSFALGGMRLRRTFLDDVESLDVLGACAKIACPTLVTHGDADAVVPLADGREIAAAIGDAAELQIFPGADHRFSGAADLDLLLDASSAWLVRGLRG